MKSVSGLMLGLMLSLWLGTSWSHSLTITVENISEAGELHIAIYDSKETFEQDRGEKGGPATGIVDGLIQATQAGTFVHVFDIPAGKYAIGVFHDVNGNNSLDTNFFGMPKEQYGFSNNATGSFGPPSFDDAAVFVTKDAMHTIKLR
jgi:uncharacterized protein (DUF2141 family)